MILQMTLLLFMAAAAVKDYRSYWVPNELILAGALNGISCAFGRWFRRRDRWCSRNGVDFHPLCRFFCPVMLVRDLKLMMAMAVYMGPVSLYGY